MLVSVPCICIMGLVVMISLYGLHPLVFNVRFGAIMGRRMNIQSLDCESLCRSCMWLGCWFQVGFIRICVM